MSERSKIHFHHIGGRSGASSPFYLKAHAADLKFHIYEGDPTCLDQISNDPGLKHFSFTNRSLIVCGEDKNVSLNINYDPFTSSCYSMNEDLADKYFVHHLTGDYVIGEAFRTVRTIDGLRMTLDEVAAKDDVGLDFLTMDTQGSELDILKGAQRLVLQELIGFTSEVEFVELYRGQPQFDDLFAWCRPHGFRLVRLDAHPDWSWHRSPIGWRGKGALFCGDALFLKSPARILADHPMPRQSLAKAVFIGLVLGQIEYAVECFSLLSADASGVGDDRPKYQKMASEIASIYDNEKGLFLPSFADVFSEDQSFARFSADVTVDHIWDTDHASVRRRYFSHVDKEQFLECFPRLLSPALTAFESALVTYDMKRTALTVRAHRVQHAELLGKILGLGSVVDGALLLDLEQVETLVRGA